MVDKVMESEMIVERVWLLMGENGMSSVDEMVWAS